MTTESLSYPIVFLRWVDSLCTDGEGWKQVDHIDKEESLLIDTIGFIVYEDDTRFVVALSVYEGWYNSEMTIPKCAVIHEQRIASEEQQPKAKKSENRKGKRVASRTRR